MYVLNIMNYIFGNKNEDKEKNDIPDDVHCLNQSDVDPYDASKIIDFLKIRDLKKKLKKK